MEQHPHVPKFDKPRTGNVGGNKIINLNDPQQNPHMTPPEVVQVGEGLAKTDPLSRHKNPAGHGTNTESYHHQERGDGVSSRETLKSSSAQKTGGYGRRPYQSPPHPHYQAKAGVRSFRLSSPTWDRNTSLSMPGMALETPEQSRTGKHKDVAVPKFGDWEMKPVSANEFYNTIFSKVRGNKETGTGNMMHSHSKKCSGSMHKDVAVPKFGDWEMEPVSANEFSNTIFNKVRGNHIKDEGNHSSTGSPDKRDIDNDKSRWLPIRWRSKQDDEGNPPDHESTNGNIIYSYDARQRRQVGSPEIQSSSSGSPDKPDIDNEKVYTRKRRWFQLWWRKKQTVRANVRESCE